MKRILTLLTLVILTCLSMQTYASHVAGAEITYTPTGNPNEFLLRLVVYRDCNPSSSTLGTTADVCYSSASCGQSGTITLNETGILVVPSSVCVNATPGNCSQAGAPGDAEQHIYEGTVTLPSQCVDWKFSWELCCRNAAITSLVDPDLYGVYVETFLNNIAAPADNSPLFTAPSYSRFCVGNPFTFSQFATDADGDSLVFLLGHPQDAGFSCPQTPDTLEFAPGYSESQPIISSVPVTINPVNGDIFFIPSQPQVAIICVIVEEYRNGVKIGSIKRDIQIKVVANCNPVIPAFPDPIIGGTINGSALPGAHLQVNCNDRTIILPLDTTYQIQCGSAVPSDFRTLAPYGIPNPIVSVAPVNCYNGLTDSLAITFLNPLSMGVTRLWTKRGFDGNTFLSECGFELPAGEDTVYLYVDTLVISHLAIQNDSVGCVFNKFDVLLSDSVYCGSINPDGSDFTLVDATGTVIPIASAYGYCTPTGLKCNMVLINLANVAGGTAPYYLTVNGAKLDGNTLADDCGRYLVVGDTLAILYQNNYIPVYLGSDQSICQGAGNPVLSAGITAPGLNYQWSDANGLIFGAISDTLNVYASGTYSVVVTNGPTCQGTDTVSITIVPEPIDNLGNDIRQCINDPIPVLDAGNTGAAYQWYRDGIVITGATSQTYQPGNGQGGVYSVRVDNGSNCIQSYDILVDLISAYAATLSNETVCQGTQPTLLSVGPFSDNPSIQWSVNNNPIPGATSSTYQPTASGIYSVAIGNGSCVGSASMTLAIVPVPVDSLGSDLSQCISTAMPTFDVHNAGASYQWSTGGSPITGATGQTYTPTNPGTAGTYTYSVHVDYGAGCVSDFDINLDLTTQYSASLSNETICQGATATQLSIGPFGGNPSIQWFQNGQPISGATSTTYQPTTAGQYSVTVGSGTCAANASMNLTVVANPSVSLTNQTICDTDPIPTLNIGTQPSGAAIVWSDASGPIAGETGTTYQPSVAGQYTATVTVQPGCTSSATMDLTINSSPNFTMDDQTICSDGMAILETHYATSGSYLWSTGATTDTIHTNVQGWYYLTVTAAGCSRRDSAFVGVETYPVAPIIACGSGTSLQPAYTYLYSWAAVPNAVSYEVSYDNGATWAAANGANGPETHGTNESVPFFLVRAIGGGICKIGAASEPAACKVTAPNVINPNSDKHDNTFFNITNIAQYPNNKVQIFNRWGKEVFTASPYDNVNKVFDGKDVPDGTYFYIINLGQDGEKPITGTLTIIK